ncbi:ABC transporter transmembrane domain-containing protein [Bosea sp. 2YAB26]|uniref:ABC transporter transmembrane domain-containing protein n=1 Tax=Bosea sp. 2YAB26 TaxID=3237478 RepID=UPI003F91194E
MSSIFLPLLRRIRPSETSAPAIASDQTLSSFVWRASGAHQFYVGLIAMAVALLNFAPIDLQRRIVDVAIANRDVRTLLFLGALYLAIVLLQAALKYALLVYQGWVSESVVKKSRDHLTVVATERASSDGNTSGQTVNVIGREIDGVGGFVGVGISEFVVNLTFLCVILGYMLYIQPLIALISMVFLLPQVFLALYMQADLNTLVERQVGLVRKLGDETVAQSGSGARSGPESKPTPTESATIHAIFRNRIRFYVLKYGLKTLLNVANAIGPLMVLIVGGWMVIQGQTTIGTVVAFISGLERLSSPLRDLLNFYREYQQAKVQYQMIGRWVEGKT